MNYIFILFVGVLGPVIYIYIYIYIYIGLEAQSEDMK